MALPTTLSSCAGCVEVMVAGTTFTDYSDEIAVVNTAAMTRAFASQHVFGEDIAAIGYGKRDPFELTIRGVYQESTTSLYYLANVSFQTACGALFAIGYSPGGCTTDNRRLRTSTTVAKITSLTPPQMDAGTADVLMWEATVATPDLTEAVWA